MLSQNLKALVRAGLVDRTVEATVPPQVTYSLTAPGTEMAVPPAIAPGLDRKPHRRPLRGPAALRRESRRPRHAHQLRARRPTRVLPGMRAQGSGTIVNIGSAGGLVTAPGGGAYHMTKYALESLSDALRLEVRPF